MMIDLFVMTFLRALLNLIHRHWQFSSFTKSMQKKKRNVNDSTEICIVQMNNIIEVLVKFMCVFSCFQFGISIDQFASEMFSDSD